MEAYKRHFLRTKSLNKLCFWESTSTFLLNKSAQPPHSVIFHFSYLLHLEGCHRGEVCSAALQEIFSGLHREKSLRLVLNSPVTMSLSSVWGHCFLSELYNWEFSYGEGMQCMVSVSRQISIPFFSTASGLWIAYKCHKIEILQDLLTVDPGASRGEKNEEEKD